MKTYLCLYSGLVASLLSSGCVGASQAAVEPPVPVVVAPPAPVEKGSLDELVAPIALYPDALVALILPAATTGSDVVLAARYLAGGGDRTKIDEQAWDDSVKGLAHYPDVVKWMDENLAWTQRLGEAYLATPQDVMAAIQRDRARAQANGVLKDTEQQQVVMEDGNVRIVPANPEIIYVPRYDPQIVYVERPIYYWPDPWVTFGIGFGVGSWLAYDCDWYGRTIWIDPHRHDRWRRDHRDDWRRPHFPDRPGHLAGPRDWHRWSPRPDRYAEHRRHFDRHPNSNWRPDGIVGNRPGRPGDRPDAGRPDRDNRDVRPTRPDRRPQPDRVPAVAHRPEVPTARSPGGSAPRPGTGVNRVDDRGREPDRSAWRNPAHPGGRPGVPAIARPVPPPPTARPTPEPARREMQRPQPVHSAPPPAATVARVPAAARPSVQVQNRPEPGARQERSAERSDRRAERSDSNGTSRHRGVKEDDR